VLCYCSLGINFIVIKYRIEISEALSNLHEYGNFVLGLYSKPLKTFSYRLKSNVPGLVAMITVIFCWAMTIPVPFIWVYLKTDAIYWLLPPSNLTILFRLLIVAIFFRESVRTLIICCLIVSFETPIYFHCLDICDRQQKLEKALNAYNLLQRVRYINVKPCAEFTSVLLGSTYILLVFLHAISFVGQDLVKYLAPVLHLSTIMLDIVVYTFLPNCTRIFDWSDAMIRKWKMKLVLVEGSRNVREMTMRLKALRPIAFRCVSVGPLKWESKKQYFHSIFDGVFDVVMTFKNVDRPKELNYFATI